MDIYYKLRQLFYYKVRHGLLQIAIGITKYDDYYTLQQYIDHKVILYFPHEHFTKWLVIASEVQGQHLNKDWRNLKLKLLKAKDKKYESYSPKWFS